VRNKVYVDKAGRGTMITAIAAIIVAYDNSDSALYDGPSRSHWERRVRGGSREASERQINGGEKRVPAAAAS